MSECRACVRGLQKGWRARSKTVGVPMILNDRAADPSDEGANHMLVNDNSSSLGVQNAMATNQNRLKSSLQKLATGLRINQASDDPAALAASESLRAQRSEEHMSELQSRQYLVC